MSKQGRWVIFRFVSRGSPSEGGIGLGTLTSEVSDKDLRELLYEQGIQVIDILDSGVGEPPPLIVSFTEGTELAERQVRLNNVSVYLYYQRGFVPTPLRKTVFIETLSDARQVLGSLWKLTKRLDRPLSRKYRQMWRQKFIPEGTPHACHGCQLVGSMQGFEWEALFATSSAKIEEFYDPLDVLRAVEDLIHQPQTDIILFFERCDLPLFVLSHGALESFTKNVLAEYALDVYIAPRDEMTWSLVATHEGDILLAQMQR